MLDKPALMAELLPRLMALRAGREAADEAKVARAEAMFGGGGEQLYYTRAAGSAEAFGAEQPSAQEPLHVDVADELTKLADLRDRGVITDAEFEGQKRKILDG